MPSREILIKEIETLPFDFVDEVYHYVSFLKKIRKQAELNEITLASEQSLAKDWLSAEEDIAWGNL